MKNYFYILCLILFIAVLALTACGDKNGDINDVIYDASAFDDYIYQQHMISLPETSFPISGVLVHEDRIIYWYTDSEMFVVIMSIAADGSDRVETRIPVSGLTVMAGGLQVTEEGNYAIIMRSYDEGGDRIIYGHYDLQGSVISSQELDIIDVPDGFSIRIEQVVFADSGNIAIIISGTGATNELHLLDKDGTPLGMLPVEHSQSMIELQDGRVVLSDFNSSGNYLYVVDFTKVALGEAIPLLISNIRRISPAGDGHPFDLLVDDGYYLYGYILKSDTKITLLNWLETKLLLSQDYNIGFLSDDRIAILHTEFSRSGDDVFWITDLFILTRIPREDIPELTILTIGGFWFNDEIRQEVLDFNRNNQEYQIELRDYYDNEDWEASVNRFRVELITGRGPDIILDNYEIPRDSGIFADLYSFIDNDPVLDRSDFFPNVLKILENEDGTLPVITNSFHIQTQITLRSTAEQLKPFTFTSLLQRLDESDNPYLYGDWMHRDRFLTNAILMSGDTFINWTTGQANFDSDDFKNMLEIAARMRVRPDVDVDWTEDQGREWERMRRGEQLLYEMWLFDPEDYQQNQALLGDIVAIGMPTNEGGRHNFWEGGCIGINVSSQHKDASWTFIRRFLLPEAVFPDDHMSLPLRIDLYDQRIEQLKTPRIINDEEIPREIFLGGLSGGSIKLYAMTEDEAAAIREIVESESLRLRYDRTVRMIIDEDTQPFFAGARSVDDTARIIQNRIQRYLNERG